MVMVGAQVKRESGGSGLGDSHRPVWGGSAHKRRCCAGDTNTVSTGDGAAEKTTTTTTQHVCRMHVMSPEANAKG
jgi:hypothetical protein